MQRHGDDFHGHHRGRTKKWPRSSADVAPVPGATAVPASQTTTARPQTSTAAARQAAAWRPSLPTACPCLMESKAMWLYGGNVSNAWRVGKKKNRGQDWIVRVQFHSNNRWSYYTGIATFFFPQAGSCLASSASTHNDTTHCSRVGRIHLSSTSWAWPAEAPRALPFSPSLEDPVQALDQLGYWQLHTF